MKPFVYWFSYIDNYTTTYWTADGTIEQQDTHFLHCVLLAESAEEALSWGNCVAQDYLKLDEVFSISPGWLDEIVPEIISNLPDAPTDWEFASKAIKQTSSTSYFAGWADDPARPLENSLHALVYAHTEEDATKTWDNFLNEHYPHLQRQRVARWQVAIARIGEKFDWE